MCCEKVIIAIGDLSVVALFSVFVESISIIYNCGKKYRGLTDEHREIIDKRMINKVGEQCNVIALIVYISLLLGGLQVYFLNGDFKTTYGFGFLSIGLIAVSFVFHKVSITKFKIAKRHLENFRS